MKPDIIRVALSHDDGEEEGITTFLELTYERRSATEAGGALLDRASQLLTAWARKLVESHDLERRTIGTVVEYSDEQVFETDYVMEPEADQQGVNLGRSLWRAYASVSGIYKPVHVPIEDWAEWHQVITLRQPGRVSPLLLHNHPFDYQPTAEDLAHTLYPLNPDGTKP